MTDTPVQSDCIAVLVGGLGRSQLIPEIVSAMNELFGAENVWHGDGSNDYKKSFEIWKFINSRPTPRVFFIGHSLGVDQAGTSAFILKEQCVGAALLDPVNLNKLGTSCPTLILRAENSFPFRQAQVGDLPSETLSGTNHNSICHDPRTLEKLTDFIKQCRGI